MKLLFKILLLCVVVFSFFVMKAPAQSVWTKNYEGIIYSQVYNSINLNFPNDSVKKLFSMCVVKKLESVLPNGLAGISSDSLKNIVNKVAIECKTTLNAEVLTKWSPEFEKLLRQNIYTWLKSTLPESVKNGLCDCLIVRFKIIYANGVPKEIPVEVEKKVLGECYLKVVKSKH